VEKEQKIRSQGAILNWEEGILCPVHSCFLWPSTLHKLQVRGFCGCFVPVASVEPSTTFVRSSAEVPAVGLGSVGLGQVISPARVQEQKA